MEPNPSFSGADYFPLQTGSYIEYDVQETSYVPNSQPLSRSYQVRQEIADSIQNQSGGTTYIIYRYQREDEDEPWEYLTTWSARRDINRIVVHEGNTPFIKLSLPVRTGLIWDGNALNGKAEDTYQMAYVNLSDTISDGSIVPSLQVIQEEFDDIIVGERDIRREIYGKDIGLLEREIISLDLCPVDNCPNQEIIESGIEYREKISGYGTMD